MRKAAIIGVSLLATTLFMAGCIKEDLEDCDTTLYFSYLGDGTREIFLDKTGKVDMYVYNESGTLVQTIVLNRSELQVKQGVTLQLPDGRYRVVCWGNAYDDTQVVNGSALQSGLVGAPRYFTHQQIATNDSLYYGSREVDVSSDVYREDTVRFSSAHIKMRIELAGLDDERLADGSSPIEVVVGNLSPVVDFSKKFSDERTSYYPTAHFDEPSNVFRLNFNVLRFNDDNAVYVRLMNKETGNTVYALNLKDFMNENGITVDGINEAVIGLRFRFNSTSIIVKPWVEEEIRPGM